MVQEDNTQNQLKVGELEGKEVFELYGNLLKENNRESNELKDEIEAAIIKFEINKLPIILGGTFDTIVSNKKDDGKIQSYYFHEFQNAFRSYMIDYASHGLDADDFQLIEAFNELSIKLQKIDPSVNIVTFNEFMDGIRDAV